MKHTAKLMTALSAAVLLCACTSQESAAPAVTDMTKLTDQTVLTDLTTLTNQTTLTTLTTLTDGTIVSDGTAQTDLTTLSEFTAATALTSATGGDTQTGVTTDAASADLPDIAELFRKGASAELHGDGYVFARDGLNLRDKPTAMGKKLTTLGHGTAVKVKSVTRADALYDYPFDCWLEVDAGGKHGYVSAEFVAFSCTDAPDKLNEGQQAALGVVLFQQARKLRDYFFREGGIRATGIAKQPDADGWYAVEPKSLTLQQNLADYDKFFATEIWGGMESVYKVQNGQLYLEAMYPENPYTDHELLTQIIGITADSLTYCMYTQWYTTGEFVMFTENNGVTTAPFIIQYIGGTWKVTEFTANL